MKRNSFLTLRGLLVAALGGVVLLSSCKQDEPVQGFGDPSRAVMFTAFAKKNSLTRAVETTSANILSFSAYGIHDGTTLLQNLAPADVSRATNTDPWTYTPVQVWPDAGAINFYAFSPTGATGLTPTVNVGTQSIAYTVPAANQQDLLVAVNEGISCVNRSLVSLNFQHALSRVQVKAKSLDAGNNFTVYGVEFISLNSEGTLDLDADSIPKNGGFTYGGTPKVLWTGHATPVNYSFDLVSTAIVVDNNETNVIIDDATNDALLVLPQTTTLGSNQAAQIEDGFATGLTDFTALSDLTTITDPTDGFYVKVIYASELDKGDGQVTVKYFPVTQPGTSDPFSFEIGRSYTFLVKLSGDAYIGFGAIEVQEFDDFDVIEIPVGEAYVPAAHNGFAGSNIYWNGTQLTFDDVDDTTHEKYQGLYFKWGSLVGMSPVNDWAGTTVLYTPTGAGGIYEATTATAFGVAAWDALTPAVADRDFDSAGSGIKGITDYRLSGFLTSLNNDVANVAAYHGDICAYLSGKPGVPNGSWRMPTSAEFDPGYPDVPFTSPGAYAREGAVDDKSTPQVSDDEFLWTAGDSDQIDGTFAIANGYRLEYASNKYAFFPASGSRYFSDGALVNLGLRGYAWGSSPAVANGHDLSLRASGVYPADGSNRMYGFPVRCVKK
jgi:hypothetical protein